MRRPPPAALIRGVIALLVLLGAACAGCGGGGDVEISSATATTSPTPTVEATSTPTTPPPSIPAAPENLFAGGLLVSDYLAAGGDGTEDCLPRLVAAWDLAPVEGDRCATVPLEVDAEDFVFVVRLDAGAELPSPGDAWFFGQAENYRLVATARQLVNALTWDLQILAVDDLTGDGLDEIVLRWSDCDVEPCTVHLLIASAHRGRLQDITPDGLEFASLDSLEARDVNEDRLTDLVIEGSSDLPASEGEVTGPQRDGTTTLSWGGIRFFTSVELDPPVYLIHALLDADRLFSAGDYSGARNAYEAAARDVALLDWHAENGELPDRVNLLPYAWLRAGLAAVRSGDAVGGQQLFATAVQGHETSLIGLAAATYLGGLNSGIGPDQACSLAESVVQTRLEEWVRIWDFGTANPPHSVFDLCR